MQQVSINQQSQQLQQYPQAHHNQFTSPNQMLKKRYKINEPISDTTEVVYGFDQMSKMPKNLKVMIKILRSTQEFQRQTQLYKTLRSPYVATLLDYWEEQGLGFIVLERGSYTVDQYLSEMQGKIDLDSKKYIILDMISSWLFLYQYGFYCEFKPEDFMWYTTGHWKIINCANICKFQEILSNPGESIEFIYVDQEVVKKIINFEHSQVLHDPDVPIQTLGMMLLELFLMSPILANKSCDELIEDLRKGALMSFVSTEEDKSIFEILRHIILQNKHEQEEQNQLIMHIDALIKQWNNSGPVTTDDIKKNPGKYIKKAGAF
eukprot:403354367